MTIVRFFLPNALDEAKRAAVLEDLQKISNNIVDVITERCYHIEIDANSQLSPADVKALKWILKKPQDPDNLLAQSQFAGPSSRQWCIEIGPRFNFSTADSTNSVSICQNVGLKQVVRIETSIKYLLTFDGAKNEAEHGDLLENVVNLLGDRMTQCRYTDDNMPKASFYEKLPQKQEPWYFVPVMEHGRKALEELNDQLGLAFDNWDLGYYTNLFQNVLQRNPTSVELFDCAQSNSEHSRHWFFRGKMFIDRQSQEKSLIQMIINTQKHTNQNNTIKFSDNSSAIKGYQHKALRPVNAPSGPGPMQLEVVDSDLIFTAETHNMPTAVAPFSGATTGTGGRIRDVQGVGRGGLTIAGTAGYCVGALNIPNYDLPYEPKNWAYPPSFASPLNIIIEASNGASDYGNKFGEPVITGFAISYGCLNNEKDRDEYVKPIMFSGGLGTMDATQTNKIDPKKGMLLAKIGGPVYRIGVGGGAASSVEVQGDNSSELDFNAVQRGDAEMENKLNRVVRACIEMGSRNPILAIHDQGAGGNGNVLKELVEPGMAGAIIFSKEFQLGDPTITALELWGAEYQENNAILCKPEDRALLEAICERERCPINFVGVVSGNGFVTLIESKWDDNWEAKYADRKAIVKLGDYPFDMHLENVLGVMPKKEYLLQRLPVELAPLKFKLPPTAANVVQHLERVLSVMTVGSKRFLTNKVDRCVTGLIAQQQCVGPLHTPLADMAVTAVSHFGYEGIATSIGTQPIKGLIDARAGAQMTVAEALSNLVFAGITELGDVKCSGNWMWAAKLPGEGAKLYDACREMCRMMNELNIAVDGGKDSLSMAARVGGIGGKTIKSPGTLVVSTYAPCPDIRVKVTPDLKSPALGKTGALVWVNIERKFRLGASALAQSMGQQGDDCPGLLDTNTLKAAFNTTQKLLHGQKLLAGHDISDGGLLVCLLEMAFGGLCGLNVDLTAAINELGNKAFTTNNLTFEHAPFLALFAEECGWVLEVATEDLAGVLQEFRNAQVPAFHIGQATGLGLNSEVNITYNGQSYLSTVTLTALKQWERTGFELEKLQCNRQCAEEEFATLEYRTGPKYTSTIDPDAEIFLRKATVSIRVAVIREEGSNGDREMIASLMKANFEVHDVTMSDLQSRRTSLDVYRGVVFPGGFSYADTLGSAKGWAASILHSEHLAPQFRHFKQRTDTFALGVCNGCQLMSLIGWVGDTVPTAATKSSDTPDVALLHNKSGRYECRWSAVKIAPSKSLLLRRLAGSTLGCWIAHGEGRFSFRTPAVLNALKSSNCIALQYCDDTQQPTEVYPMNPNGSIEGIAGICSPDGRFLAMMPHPERCSEMWQWPYVPPNFQNFQKCPWQVMFDEAFAWCLKGL